MHSSCRIPEVQHIFSGLSSRRNQLCQGLGELTSRDPAWKIRRKNQVCGRRLVAHLASLNQQCAESTSRINHDIRRVRSLLPTPSYLCPALSSLSLAHQPGRFVCSATGKMDLLRNAGSRQGSGVSSNHSTEVKGTCILKDNAIEKHSMGIKRVVDVNSNKNGNSSKVDLNEGERVKSHNPKRLSLPTVFSYNDVSTCEKNVQHEVGVSHSFLPSHRGQPARNRQRWNFSARLCGHGESSTPRNCYHFPCKRPQTYSHIGFRSNHPQLKTLQWVRSRASPRTTRSQSWDISIGYAANRRRQVNPVRNKTESLKHRLPSAVKLRPVDTAFRERLLKEEADRRRQVHQMSRPADWEVNYGQPTPFKRLWYPVRLKPNELVSW
ncbi:hypothetical protein ElyMa_004610400 [Elysia marginata]|uniref:Uncharacterized protein n=1 Tax=Elysia marginata TaxID=1093978 RepID=A0AAV4I0S7_9GAST|nr:hypothetical protein ElyMa_004610400 [Elysia marginata]